MPAAPHPHPLQGGKLVSGLETDAQGNVAALTVRDTASGQEERLEADAVVFAISIAGAPRLLCSRQQPACKYLVRCRPCSKRAPSSPPRAPARHAQACSGWCRRPRR